MRVVVAASYRARYREWPKTETSSFCVTSCSGIPSISRLSFCVLLHTMDEWSQSSPGSSAGSAVGTTEHVTQSNDYWAPQSREPLTAYFTTIAAFKTTPNYLKPSDSENDCSAHSDNASSSDDNGAGHVKRTHGRRGHGKQVPEDYEQMSDGGHVFTLRYLLALDEKIKLMAPALPRS